MTIWWNKGNKSLSIHFYPQHIKLGVNVYNNGARKYIDSCFDKNIQLFGLFINYTNWNYNTITHVILHSEKEYKRLGEDESHKVRKIMEVLNAIVKLPYSERNKIKPPFSFNYEFVEGGNIVYYITAPNKWFKANGIEGVIPKACFLDYCKQVEDNKDKFPEYHPIMNLVKEIQ